MRPNYAIFSFLALINFTGFIKAQSPSPVSTTIAANNVRAVIHSNGALFTDGQQGQFIPVQPGLAEKTLLRYSGIWLAGVDPAFNLKGAVSLPEQTDFKAGLQTDISGDLNNIWKVYCADVEQHLDDYQDNGVVDNPNTRIFAYPGRGNPFFEQYNSTSLPYTLYGFADFYDTDVDNDYSPEKGDFPCIHIRGCFGITYPEEQNWFVFNDAMTHPSGLTPIEIEVQAQFFAIKTATPSPLNNAIFAYYRLINNGFDSIDSCFFGVYMDLGIGYPNDDFMGTIPDKDVIYGYNGDNNDEGGFGDAIPVMAIDLMRGPINPLVFETKLYSAIILNNANNISFVEYYRLLTGHFQDGSPAPNSGIMYPGNPNTPNEISELTAGNTPGKRFGIASYGPFKIPPGGVNELIVAYYFVHTPGNTPLQNVQQLYNVADDIQNYFGECFEGLSNVCDHALGAPGYVVTTDLLLHPNPAGHSFAIESKGEPFSRIEMTDMLGRVMRTIDPGQPVWEYSVQVDDLKKGIYWIRINGQVLQLLIQH